MKLQTQYRLIRLTTYMMATIALTGFIYSRLTTPVAKATPIQPEMIRADVTFYCLEGTTADGSEVREGICASKPEYIGLTACIYTKDDEFLGIYEIKDTGGKDVKSGKVVDIWLPTYEECIEAGRYKNCKIFLIDAKG